MNKRIIFLLVVVAILLGLNGYLEEPKQTEPTADAATVLRYK